MMTFLVFVAGVLCGCIVMWLFLWKVFRLLMSQEQEAIMGVMKKHEGHYSTQMRIDLLKALINPMEVNKKTGAANVGAKSNPR